MYVIRTDAPCLRCNDTHGYVTQMCDLSVFVDYLTARYVASFVEGSMVQEIREVPEGISYTLYLHKDGRPDAAAPRTTSSLPRG